MSNWTARKKDFIYRITGGLCWYCGRQANSIDHMQPVSRGGTGAYGNIVPSCQSCNGNKGDFTVEEYRARKTGSGVLPHVFFGEALGFDRYLPVRCMSWQGRFEMLPSRTWIHNLHSFLKRRSRKLKKSLFKLYNRMYEGGKSTTP